MLSACSSTSSTIIRCVELTHVYVGVDSGESTSADLCSVDHLAARADTSAPECRASMELRSEMGEAVPQNNHGLDSLEAKHADRGRIECQESPAIRGKTQPSGGQDPEQMTVGKQYAAAFGSR
jgi:hypothetical protein